ncbi:hypothetical protein Gotur_032810, partial [Gossypium turneri]
MTSTTIVPMNPNTLFCLVISCRYLEMHTYLL